MREKKRGAISRIIELFYGKTASDTNYYSNRVFYLHLKKHVLWGYLTFAYGETDSTSYTQYNSPAIVHLLKNIRL